MKCFCDSVKDIPANKLFFCGMEKCQNDSDWGIELFFNLSVGFIAPFPLCAEGAVV